jgi:hypothetical protein
MNRRDHAHANHNGDALQDMLDKSSMRQIRVLLPKKHSVTREEPKIGTNCNRTSYLAKLRLIAGHLGTSLCMDDIHDYFSALVY